MPKQLCIGTNLAREHREPRLPKGPPSRHTADCSLGESCLLEAGCSGLLA